MFVICEAKQSSILITISRSSAETITVTIKPLIYGHSFGRSSFTTNNN